MSIGSEIIGLKAKANAAQQLAKVANMAEPLSAGQREIVLLILAGAYADGMIDGIESIASRMGS